MLWTVEYFVGGLQAWALLIWGWISAPEERNIYSNGETL